MQGQNQGNMLCSARFPASVVEANLRQRACVSGFVGPIAGKKILSFRLDRLLSESARMAGDAGIFGPVEADAYGVSCRCETYPRSCLRSARIKR